MAKPYFSDRLGMPPEAFRGGVWDPELNDMPVGDAEHRIVRPGPKSKGKRITPQSGKSRFNLKGVIEVLTEHGLNPIAALAEQLQEKVPVYDRSGNPVLDGKTGEPLMKYSLDGHERARLLMAMTEYVHPKLKSVEMTVKKPELTDEQLNARLAALLAAATKPATPTTT